MSRQTIAVSVKASKLTARALAYVVAAVGRKIAKEHRKAQTPHGKQSVRKLMGHGGDTNAIEVDTPKLFDKVARKWGVDYAIRRVGDEKYLLLFKARQADAITGCFAEYAVCGERHFHRDCGAADGVCYFALWPACAGRMAACQAGRAEQLPAGLHHRLSSGHGGQKMQKTAADPSHRLSYGKEDCLRPQPTSNLTSGPISGRPCKA